MLSSSIPNPIPPFGSSVTLICTVELSPAVDVPVTVNTVLSTDEGFSNTRTAQPVMGSSTNYAATSIISPFTRNNSGVYTCAATASLPFNAYISGSGTARVSVRVTTGKIRKKFRNIHLSKIIFQVFILHWGVCKLLIAATSISEALVNLPVLYSASLTTFAAVIRILHVGSGTYQMEH